MKRDSIGARLAVLLPLAALLLGGGCSGSSETSGRGRPGGSDGFSVGTGYADGFTFYGDDRATGGRADLGATPDGGRTEVPAAPGPDTRVTPDASVAPPDTFVRDAGATPPPCGYGDVIGVVCAPSGQVYINDALVHVDTVGCDGLPRRIETRSDANGEYLLEDVPTGPQTVEIRKGSFQHTVDVVVQGGQLNDLRGSQAKLCFGATAARIAVVSGTYDSIQEVLDGLGVDYDAISDDPPLFFGSSAAADFLMDADRLAEYHILFLNCSEWSWDTLFVYGDSNVISINLSTFVQNGGSLYASDWAFSYIERPWPGAIDFYGDDTDPWAAKIGVSGQRTATVQDSSLAAFLGKERVLLNFDLEHWVAMSGASSSVLTHIDGSIPEAGGTVPLLVSFSPYPLGGRVLFTSFHNEAQITEDMGNILNFLVFSL